MEIRDLKCDECGRRKEETNHWLVSIERPEYEGILFQPAEATESPRNPLFVFNDLCCQGCAHKHLGRWLDELKSAFAGAESVKE